jgi:diguanylate cyclase (GGDEF)-like protein
MPCERVHKLISARIDREIKLDNQELEEHLKGCPSCRDELESMRRLDEILWRTYAPKRSAAQPLSEKVIEALRAKNRPGRRCSVLLVDDEPSILMLFRGLLADEFDVFIATSGRDAQGQFTQHEIDIILTDQRMPDMSGVELLEWVVANHPKTQRLLWTGFAELEEAVAAVNRGQVFRYIFKPPDLESLREALRAAAQIVQLERDYQRVLCEKSELNAQLEERVRERTRELEQVNRELELRTQTLEKFALTDALTLLPNRRALDHFAERELYLRRRFPAPLAIGIIDVDSFKSINTRFHHTGGDQVLQELARRMAGALRKIDILGRWAGDEFMLIAPQTHRGGALAVAKRLQKAVRDHEFQYKGQSFAVTVSVGVAVLDPARDAEYEQIKLVAAAALARAKERGGNCIELVTVADESEGEGRGAASA